LRSASLYLAALNAQFYKLTEKKTSLKYDIKMKPKDVTSHHDPMGGFCGCGGNDDEDEDSFIPSDDLNINCSSKKNK